MVRAVLGLLIASASAAAAAPVQLTVGHGVGTPGGVVTIDVQVDPADQTAIGAGNDIEYGPPLAIRLRPDGSFDCAANPLLVPILAPTFTCVSPSTAPCSRLRALIFRPLGGGTLPPGLFYSCAFAIAPDAVPGSSLPLRILAPRATGVVGRALGAAGTSGAIAVLAPTATATPSETPVPTDTPTRTASATLTATVTATVTATGTVTRTRTVTRTPTRTPTPRTPVPTATATATPAVILRGADVRAAPGGDAILSVAIEDRLHRVSGVTLDLLLPFAVVDVRDVVSGCTLAPRLGAHALSAAAVGDPPVAPDLRRLRLVVSEQTVPAQVLGDGPLLTCVAPLRAAAPPGSYPLALERLFAADADGTLLLGVRAVSGSLTVDPDAPSMTPTVTATGTAPAPPSPSSTRTPSATAPPPHTATASAVLTGTAALTPTEAPSATPPASATVAETPSPRVRCAGDCDGDGVVRIDELVVAIGIANGATPLDACLGLDVNRDGAITIDEIVDAVVAALSCGG